MLLGFVGMLFVGRVVVQLLQRFSPVRWLPGFEQWQSGSVPYWSLVIMQLAIIAAMLMVVVGRRLVAHRWVTAVRTFGVLYFLAMATRLLVGLTAARDHSFLDRPLPSIFHMVIASFVVIWAQVSIR